ncbi:MAG: 2-hydroxyacid dehydrogenase [Granulosicoccus sp.]|nr:2-hydroxyacid dehydrogenase [Granulosicoccus sp.]
MTEIAIIGDHFMLPDAFEQSLLAVCDTDINIKKMTQPWPDEPMEHGYAVEGMQGLKEYMGDPDEIVEFIDRSEVLITHLAPISVAMLEKLKQLKFIAVSRGGPVNIDMNATRERGITVVNTPGRNASAVAEFTLGAMLTETRKIRVGHEALRQGQWRGDLYRADTTGRELNELTIGVIGYGDIGKRVVKLLTAFGATVLVADPYVQLSADDMANGVKLLELGKLLEQSDVVTMHARVTEETEQMMNRETFDKMKPGSLFINTARGPLVDYDALFDALQTGHLGSAMLETFAVEPVPPDWPLLQLPNVTLTPHIAGASVKTVTYAADQAAMEVNRYLNGLEPINMK